MTTGDALLAAIWERPHDDLPRLAYADWLDDQGAPEQVARAEFIRVQCELARLDAADPPEPGDDLNGGWGGAVRLPGSPARAALAARADRLQRSNARA